MEFIDAMDVKLDDSIKRIRKLLDESLKDIKKTNNEDEGSYPYYDEEKEEATTEKGIEELSEIEDSELKNEEDEMGELSVETTEEVVSKEIAEDSGESDIGEEGINEEESIKSEEKEEKEVLKAEDVDTTETKTEISPIALDSLLQKLGVTKRKRDKIKIIDELGAYISHDEVRFAFIDLLKNDPSALVRAKCASYLADVVSNSEDAKETLFNALSDPSPKVRHWVVWGLGTIVSEEDVRERLIYQLLYKESSKLVKNWIMRVLSTQLSDERVEQVFLQLLRKNPDKRTKIMLINYLSKKLDDIDVVYTLSNLAIREKNPEIKKILFKTLLHSEDPDAKYAIDRIQKEVKDSLKWLVEDIVETPIPRIE